MTWYVTIAADRPPREPSKDPSKERHSRAETFELTGQQAAELVVQGLVGYCGCTAACRSYYPRQGKRPELRAALTNLRSQ